MSRRAMSNRRLLIPTNRKHLLKLPPPCNVCWWLVLINRWFTFQGSRTHEVPSGAALQRHDDLIHTLRAELMLIIKLYLPFVYLDTSSRKIASSSNITNVKQPILSQIFIINSHTSMLRTQRLESSVRFKITLCDIYTDDLKGIETCNHSSKVTNLYLKLLCNFSFGRFFNCCSLSSQTKLI